MPQRTERGEFGTGAGNARAIAFSVDSRFLASAHEDGTVKLWNVEDRRLITTWRGNSQPVLAVAFSPDGRHVASAGGDHAVRVWAVP
jgi:WD40 repeat protein